MVKAKFEDFELHIAEATCMYDRYVVLIKKPLEDFEVDLKKLVEASVESFNSRAPGQRHAISCNAYLTVIVNKRDDSDQVFCGIYFNLKSPFISLRGESLLNDHAQNDSGRKVE